ncbi:MAG TPA: hypothetical protein PKJ33_02825 [Alphaproteobacteria bacterium]|nr:hypothetical protein [Alphaproteobacteria bacterium]
MTDPDRSRNNKYDFFQESYNLPDKRGKQLALLHFSYTTEPVVGNFYVIHGYGGSLYDPFLLEAAKIALTKGYNVIGIENPELSLTNGVKKNITKMNIARHSRVIQKGLEYCKDTSKKNSILWAHSYACGAFTGLFMKSKVYDECFNAIVFNNPILMTPIKVLQAKKNSLKKDPTGKSWAKLSARQQLQNREFDGVRHTIPARIKTFEIPMPRNWKDYVDVEKCSYNYNGIATELEGHIKNTQLFFILGTEDDKAEYALNKKIFESLKHTNKKMFSINAGHDFENKLDEYLQCSNIVFENILSSGR